jgi:RND family efflux transporter MFP subunit
MTVQGAAHRKWFVTVAAGLALAAAGSVATYVVMRPSAGGQTEAVHGPTHATGPTGQPTGTAGGGSSEPASHAGHAASWPDVQVPISREAIERAGIGLAPVEAGGTAASLRLPGVIEPHAYRQVAVTPLAGGRVTSVHAELGEHVRRGQVLARIYSPDLADAHARYVAARAQLDAHDRELQRTSELAGIGAASRQELERAHADHAAQVADVASARARLELLGGDLPPSGEPAPVSSAIIDVPAPIDGVVTARSVNVGLNVDPTMPLFTVVDLSTVWVIADVSEQDLGRVRVGSPASVTTAAEPGVTLSGRVSYIDPQIAPATRTARLRVEVPNRGGRLRLGMYANVRVQPANAETAIPVIPRTALQQIGDRTVVYIASSSGEGPFIEREVRLGASDGDRVEVLSGLVSGDLIVTRGSFFLRAERERLGLRTPAGDAARRPPG